MRKSDAQNKYALNTHFETLFSLEFCAWISKSCSPTNSSEVGVQDRKSVV